jgi:hypothetical protein
MAVKLSISDLALVAIAVALWCIVLFGANWL